VNYREDKLKTEQGADKTEGYSGKRGPYVLREHLCEGKGIKKKEGTLQETYVNHNKSRQSCWIDGQGLC